MSTSSSLPAAAKFSVFVVLGGVGLLAGQASAEPALASQLRATDTIVVRRWKDEGPAAVVVSGQRNVSTITRAISWKQVVQDTCGYQWTIHFLAKGRLLATALARSGGGCDLPRILFTSGPVSFESQSFVFDRALASALRPYTNRLNDKKRVSFLYNYFVDVSLAPEVAVARLARSGLQAFVLERHPQWLPTAEVRRSFPRTKDCQVDYAAERRCEQRAMTWMRGTLDALERAGAVRHFTVAFGSSYSGSFMLEASVALDPARVNETLTRLKREEITILQLRRPSSYAVQVACQTRRTPQQLSQDLSSLAFIKKVAPYGVMQPNPASLPGEAR